VLLEEGARLGVVRVAGHDVPGNGPARLAREVEDLFGGDLEERFVTNGRDGKLALGTVVAKAGSLPAGDEKRADLPFAKERNAAARGVGVGLAAGVVGDARVDLDGAHVARDLDGRL